jgi:hypothetical protein
MALVESRGPAVLENVYLPHCVLQSARSSKMNRGREVLRGKLWMRKSKNSKVCRVI